MHPKSVIRWLIALAAVLPASAFFAPLWKIELSAPQYPEGLCMHLWCNRITGDLRSINILNHYIGMRKIVPDEFWEFRYFPFVIGALIGAGLLAAATGRRWMIRLWAFILVTAASLGLLDFYLWEYRFGHELSQDAPIKFEGMAYQPPLIGVRSLLNISAWSLPSIAGYALLLSVLIAIGAVVWDAALVRQSLKKAVKPALAVAVALLTFPGCTRTGPEQIAFGSDQCAECRMTISDRRFGGEAVSSTGKVHKFDSLSCLAAFLSRNPGEKLRPYVVDATDSGRLIGTESAHFMASRRLHAPMGEALLAASDVSKLAQVASDAQGAGILRWEDVLRRLRGQSPHP